MRLLTRSSLALAAAAALALLLSAASLSLAPQRWSGWPAQAPDAAAVNASALALLRWAADCWAWDGAWQFEPESFYGNPRGELDRSGKGYGLNASERVNEIGYRWVPAPRCAPEGGAYLRNADLARALLSKVAGCFGILTVGDSMTVALAETLSDYTRSYNTSAAPGRAIRNTVVRSAYATLNTAFQRTAYGYDLGAWAPLLDKNVYDVIVINRGVHYKDDATMLPEFEATLAHIVQRQPHALVVVRTSPSGHPNCTTKRNRPPNTVAEQLRENEQFGWGRVETQSSRMAFMVTERFARARMVIMDVVPATSVRADSHRTSANDCLHYASPGPVDMWAELFGNIILYAQRLELIRAPCSS